MRYITVEYQCLFCNHQWHEIPMRERADKEDVCDWMDDVARAAGLDHVKVSPLCPSQVLNLRIPMADAQGSVGRMVRQ